VEQTTPTKKICPPVLILIAACPNQLPYKMVKLNVAFQKRNHPSVIPSSTIDHALLRHFYSVILQAPLGRSPTSEQEPALEEEGWISTVTSS